MTHRTVKIDGTLFNIFDSQLGADHFRKKAAGDVSVILRRKMVLMRRNGVEMIIRPDAGSGNDPRQKSGMAILDEIEKLIQLETGTADDFPTISLKSQATAS